MPRRTADANFTTMRLDDLLRNRKPQTCAVILTPRTRRIGLIEPIKQTRQRLLVHADA